MVTIITGKVSVPCWGKYGTDISFPMILIKYLRQGQQLNSLSQVGSKYIPSRMDTITNSTKLTNSYHPFP